MNQLIQDIRYGLRGMLKRPGFTFVAVLTLGLGIGANAAIFSVVNAVLLKPLHFKNPEQLVMVWEDAAMIGFPQNTPAPANYVDWKNQSQSFQDMAADVETSFNLTGNGDPERVAARAVTANFFSLLGVQPALGRAFTNDETNPGSDHVALLSYPLWQSRFGGDRNVLNREIQLNGEKYTVVGIMPAGFQFIDPEVRMWIPLAFTPEDLAARNSHYLTVVARLKPDVTLASAQADMTAVMRRIAQDHPAETIDGKLGAIVIPLHDQLSGDSKKSLVVLLVAVAFVLLIACANIASLLLARAAGRRREIAVRTALGAHRFRIVRQLLTESLLLSLFGGLLGLGLAFVSFGFFRQLIPEGLALSTDLRLDGSVLLFGLIVSVLTGIVFGLVPALQSTRVELNDALKQSAGRSGAGASSRLRSAMIVFEVSLSLVLLVGAGLLIQTLYQLFNQYSVLEPQQVLTLRTELPLTKYEALEKRAPFYRDVLQRVENTPGVVSAGYATTVPLLWKGGTSGFYPEGLKQPLAEMAYDANHRQISSHYLQTMKVPLREGRYFDDHDNQQSIPVAIVNETMARQYWPGENAIGRRFILGDPHSDTKWITIVGIVADIRQMGLDAPVKAEMYFPYQQSAENLGYIPRDLVVRTTGNPKNVLASVREAIHAADPDQPISNIATMEEVLGKEGGQRRLGMILISAFATLALLLASLGIYSILAYFVSQHRNEIGVRMALGASPQRIVWLVLKKGMSLTLLGVGIGLAASFALTRLMSSLLFGVRPADPLTYLAVPVLLGFVAVVACLVPARRAVKVDPVVALRYE
ncbi:MAG TPA: ABC transporter permease [Pyrinomonadaceae bacterium]|nr:ABC transporter permease [Pyrinomonadaceae bacterium]